MFLGLIVLLIQLWLTR